MTPRNLAIAAGVALLSAHLFKTVVRQLDELRGPSEPGAEDERRDGASSEELADRTETTAQTRPMSDGPAVESIDGQFGSAPHLVETLKASEKPAAGFPTDLSNDADRVRPGMGDFARGA